jgi:hypothetical protein
VLKIVGMDVPLVLDAIPRKRGQSKHEIVEQLLTHATEMVDLDLVMMDREFDSEGVKATCASVGSAIRSRYSRRSVAPSSSVISPSLSGRSHGSCTISSKPTKNSKTHDYAGLL